MLCLLRLVYGYVSVRGVDSVVVFLVAVIVHPSIHVAEELDSPFSLLSGLVHLLRR